MADQETKAAFARGGWRDVWRAFALGFFLLTHMQDVIPGLCPLAVALVGFTYLSEVIWYRRWPLAFMLVFAFTTYELLMFYVHHNYADGTAKTLFFTSGRYLYLFIVFVSFAHIRATARFEPLLFNAALVVVAPVCLLCMFSLFVKPLSVGTAPLSNNGAVTGMLGANNDSGGSPKTGAERVRNSKNAMGLALGGVLAMVVAAYLHRFRWQLPRCINAFTLLLTVPILMAFVLAKSRGCLLAFTGVMLVASFLVVRRYPRWQTSLVALIVLVGLGGCLANSQRDAHNTEANIWTRIELWKRGARLLSQSPLIGIGVGSFEQVGVHYQSIVPYLAAVRTSGRPANGTYHGGTGAGASTLNSYLQLLLDFGLLGCLLYFGWLWQAVHMGRETLEPDPRDDDVSEMIRQHARWNFTVVGMTLIFVGLQAMTETCVFLGPNGLMIFAACFGRLVSQVHTLRTRRALAAAPIPSSPVLTLPLYATT
jgi:hypothetical protein